MARQPDHSHIGERAPAHVRNELERHLLRRKMVVEQEKALAKEVIEQAEDVPNPQAKLPGDARALRGIPVVGAQGGMGGAIPGTRPEDALKQIERDEERSRLDQ